MWRIRCGKGEDGGYEAREDGGGGGGPWVGSWGVIDDAVPCCMLAAASPVPSFSSLSTGRKRTGFEIFFYLFP